MTETRDSYLLRMASEGSGLDEGEVLVCCRRRCGVASRMLWCFWLYNASRAVPSVQLSKLHESVIFGRWTLKKCEQQDDRMRQAYLRRTRDDSALVS
jgi:hypothetical protein